MGNAALWLIYHFLQHPAYNPNQIENDIALLELGTPANTTVSEVGIITKLATDNVDEKILAPYRKCYIIGWGYETDDNGRF